MHKMISCHLIFVLIISCFYSITSLLAQSMNQSQIELEKLVEIQNYLKKINKPAVKTIKSPDGDFIDCVLFNQQPAFDNPLLQGHIPTTDPPELPTRFLSDDKNDTFDEEVSQLWRLSGETCPENTIPIRRTTEEDVLKEISLQAFGRKRAMPHTSEHDYAIMYKVAEWAKFYGAQAYINSFHPRVENKGEFSISQIWLTAGANSGSLNTIEAGTIAWYGDKTPKLFVYWTSDGYKNTGCYNLLCSGFVQIRGKAHVALGTALLPVSTLNGKQFGIKLTMWKSRIDGNWWLAVNGNAVGYWPSSLFTHLREHAEKVELGGEIVNLGIGGRHTKTEMGSAHFPFEGFGRAAYMHNVEIVYSNNKLFPAGNMAAHVTKVNCYDARLGVGSKWGTYMYYGGPGGNAPYCT